MANAGRVGVELDAAFGPGVGMVMAHKKAQAGKTRFRAVAEPGEVRRVLERVSLDTVLAIYPRLDTALVANDGEPADGQQGPRTEGQRRPIPGARSAGDGGVVE